MNQNTYPEMNAMPIEETMPVQPMQTVDQVVTDPWQGASPAGNEVPELSADELFGNGEATAVPTGVAEQLSSAVQLNDEGMLVEGTPAQGNPGRQNMTRLTKGDFAMDESEEIAALSSAFLSDGDIFMDDQGIMHTGDPQDPALGGQNMTRLTKGDFAMDESEEIAALSSAFLSDGDIFMDDQGIMHTGDPQDPALGGQNMTRLTKGDFAVQQWHVANPKLKEAEIRGMNSRYPQARWKILSSGYMVWLVTMKISQTGFCKPWTFLLRYEADHPNNHGYGGSIHVTLVNPTYDELQRRAREAGRPGVPHLVRDRLSDGQEYVYLCTRAGDDIESGETTITSAVQVAGWAADWAAHFEVALRNKDVWNSWCDDDHFRHLQIR